MNEEILKEIERIKDLSDFDKRKELRGFGFTICNFIHQFYKTEEKEYKENYLYMFKILEKIYNQANEGTKEFKVLIEIKNRRNKDLVLNYEEEFKERTREEVIRRILEKKFYNYYSNSNKPINNPIFKKINIKEVLKE